MNSTIGLIEEITSYPEYGLEAVYCYSMKMYSKRRGKLLEISEK